MSAHTPLITLRITEPDGSFREATHEGDFVILGSGPSAGIHLADPLVSATHLMLKRVEGHVVAIDLASERGSEVDGHRLSSPQMLPPGAVLRLGGSTVRAQLRPEGRETMSMSALQGLSAEAVFGNAPAAAPPGMRRPVVEEVAVAPVPQAPVAVPPRAQPIAPVAAQPLAPVAARPAAQPVAAAVARPAPPTAAPVHAPPLSIAAPRTAAVRSAAAAREEAAAWQRMTASLALEEAPTGSSKVLQVSQGWGTQLLAVEHFADGSDVQAGEKRGAHFLVPMSGRTKRFVLARATHSNAHVFLPPGAHFRARVGGRELNEESLRAAGAVRKDGKWERLELGLRDAAQVSFEGMHFGVRFVKPAPTVRVRGIARSDARFLSVAAACLTLFGAVLVGLAVRPAQPWDNSTESLASNAAFVQLVMKRPPPPPPAKKKLKPGMDEGAKAQKDEGKMGKPEEKKAEADPSDRGSPIVTRRAREEQREKVMKTGLVALLNASGGAASNVLGPGGIGAGINRALGGLKAGGGLTDAHGLGGLGSRGDGVGGSGTGLGLGGLGTKGAGQGKGGYGNIELAGKDKELVRVVPGKTTVIGGLSKEVIAGVIKQHQGEIKYCYESQLNQHPDLNGKVAVLFNIDGKGSVSEASVAESTLGSSPAEQCMLAKIRRWRFPEPVGNGIVTVTFPWVFKPAG